MKFLETEKVVNPNLFPAEIGEKQLLMENEMLVEKLPLCSQCRSFLDDLVREQHFMHERSLSSVFLSDTRNA